jgi:hypothetical protein
MNHTQNNSPIKNKYVRLVRLGQALMAIAVINALPLRSDAQFPPPPPLMTVLSVKTTFRENELTNKYEGVQPNFDSDLNYATLNYDDPSSDPVKIRCLQDIADLLDLTGRMSSPTDKTTYTAKTKDNINELFGVDGASPGVNSPAVLGVLTNFSRAELPLIRSVTVSGITAQKTRTNLWTGTVKMSVQCGYSNNTSIIGWTVTTVLQNADSFAQTMTSLYHSGMKAGAVIDAIEQAETDGVISDHIINIAANNGTPLSDAAQSGKFPLTINTGSGIGLIIIGTTNLTHWVPVYTNNAAGTEFDVFVPTLAPERTFYRSVH